MQGAILFLDFQIYLCRVEKVRNIGAVTFCVLHLFNISRVAVE
jgi:hypothetical protein